MSEPAGRSYDEAYIELKDVTFRHRLSDADAISHVSLSFRRGECVLLCGESGSGKTTVTRLINGLIPHFYEGDLEGETYAAGLCVTSAELYETARVVGSVFQNPRSQLFCETVEEEVRLGMREEYASGMPEVLEQLNLESLLGQHPMAVSGGQKQRIAIASAILAGKDILVFDEPTSGLDHRHMQRTAGLIASLKGKRTVFVVTHDPALIRGCCTHILQLERGRVKACGPVSSS